ncbi:leishmanolysin-like peptidase [Sycon ciliatum]|uniref:leishmanolysin-like peptidase n=1 Tax=Sycon ciliatum TaxID=27933 RepID=UPI0031F617A0
MRSELWILCVLCTHLASHAGRAASNEATEHKTLRAVEKWHTQRNTHIDVASQLPAAAGRSRRQATGGRMPIRIYASYDSTSMNTLTASKRELIMTLTTDAVNYFSSVYSVVPLTSPIRVPRTCTGDLFIPSLSTPGQRACLNGCTAQTLCGGVVPVPTSHLTNCTQCTQSSVCTSSGSSGAGVSNADLVIYVGAYSTMARCSGNTVAFASSCVQEATLDRPVAGYINLCPDTLNLDTASYAAIQGTIRHEIYHILAFSPSLFAYYRDSSGNPLTARLASRPNTPASGFVTTTAIAGLSFVNGSTYQWNSNTVRPMTLSGWVAGSAAPTTLQTYYMVTPKVTEFVRSHFSCPTLEGAILENQGGEGTALTHWEKRTFENEVMTGTFTQDYSYSRLTMSLMEDTGWYGVNYSLADDLVWGKNAGCDFVSQSCGSWMTARNSTGVQPFCLNLATESRRFFCNVDHSAKAVCNLAQFTTGLPTLYRYMTPALLPGVDPSLLSRYGGGTSIADFCPYYTAFKDSVSGKRTECYESKNAPTNSLSLEFYGAGSRCITHGRPWSNGQFVQSTFGSGCYQTFCSAPSSITIRVGSQDIDCTGRAGAEVAISQTSDGLQYTGSIVCPSYAAACSTISSQATHMPGPGVSTATTPTGGGVTVATTTSSGATVTSPSMSLSQLLLLTIFSTSLLLLAYN